MEHREKPLLEKRIAVVTAVKGSLGEGIARRFGREGAVVVAVDADREAAKRCAALITDAGGTAIARGADILAPGEAVRLCREVADELGGLDILVNAGQATTPVAPLRDKDPDNFGRAFREGPLAAILMMQAAYPHLQARGGGRIVNVGSFYGPTANCGVVDAVASDGALAALTRAAGVEWARENILVNFLQAGAPDIPEFHAYRQADRDAVDGLVANLALGRLADPVEDVGGAATFLASDEGCFVVGHTIFADGGQHLAAPAYDPGFKVV
ncbi:MAG: SDR family oxidoreductase [Caulobacteraceae bacterium]|nr:SDR family oxidoreductase [Caulobacteraceae bacterium]